MKQANRAIKEYENIFGKNKIRFEPTHTHIKLAIADRNVFILGSMNLLSSQSWEEYKGLHSEIALMSKDKKVLSELFDKYFGEFH